MIQKFCILAILAIASAAPIASDPDRDPISDLPATPKFLVSKRDMPTDLPQHEVHLLPAPFVLRRSIPAAAHTTGSDSTTTLATSATFHSTSSDHRFTSPKGEMAPPSHSRRDEGLAKEVECEKALDRIGDKFVVSAEMPQVCIDVWKLPIPDTNIDTDLRTQRKRDIDWSEVFGIDTLFRKSACKFATGHWHVPESWSWNEIPDVCKMAYNMSPSDQLPTKRDASGDSGLESPQKRDTDWSELLGIDNLLEKASCKLQTKHWSVPESWAWDEIPYDCKLAYNMYPSDRPSVKRDDTGSYESGLEKRDVDWSEVFGIDNLLQKIVCKTTIGHWHVPESWAWDEIPEVCKVAYNMAPSDRPAEKRDVARHHESYSGVPVEKNVHDTTDGAPTLPRSEHCEEHHGEMSRTERLRPSPIHPPRMEE